MNGSLTTTRFSDFQLLGTEILSEGVGGVNAGAPGSKTSSNIVNNSVSSAARFLIRIDQSTAKQELANVL